MIYEETLLDTKQGLKYANQISQNDFLLSFNFKWIPILSIQNRFLNSEYKIKLDRGIFVILSRNHKILTIDKKGNFIYKTVKNLKIDDIVLTPFNYNLFPQSDYEIPNFKYVNNYENRLNFPQTLNSDLGYIIGHFVGDGSYSDKGYTIVHTFSKNESVLEEYVRSQYEKVFGFKPDVKKFKCWTDQGVHRLNKGSKPLVRFYRDYLGVIKNKSSLKIPFSILQSSQQTICRFLSGLFDADGSVNKINKHPSLSSCSQYLVNQIQVLFWSLGIESYQSCPTMKIKYKGRIKAFKNPNLELRGGKPALQKFEKLIGFHVKHKQERLSKFAHRNLKKECNRDKVYYINLIYQGYKDLLALRIHNQKIKRAWSWAPKYTQNKTDYCPITVVDEMIHHIKKNNFKSPNFKKLEMLRNLKYFFQKIVSIEKIDKRKRFVKIKTDEPFIGNGLVHICN